MALPQIAATVASNAPKLLSIAQQYAPAAFAKAQTYITRATGKPVDSIAVQAEAGNTAMGGLVLEALLKSGMSSKVISEHIPVLTKAELDNFRTQINSLRKKRDDEQAATAGPAPSTMAEVTLDFAEIEWACRLLAIRSDDLPRLARVLRRANEPLIEQYQMFFKSLGKQHS